MILTTSTHCPIVPGRHFICRITILLFLLQCDRFNPNAPSSLPTDRQAASARITITVDNVATLSKRHTIDLVSLVLTLASHGEDTIRDTVALSGTGGGGIHATIGDLAAPKNWTIRVLTYDQADSVIHSGSTTFSTFPTDTAEVSLNLAANYSMLRVSFNNTPDSAVTFTLSIDGVYKAESTMTTAGNPDTVVLAYDYLKANTLGIEHEIALKVQGTYFGTNTILYRADTSFSVVSGVDKVHSINLTWVGTEVPEIGIANNLTASYPFTGNANDESGNEHNGMVEGAVLTTDRFGNANCAYSFDGIDDRIQTNYNGITGNHPRSVSLWVKRSVADTQAMFCVAYGAGSDGKGNTFRCGVNYLGKKGITLDASNGIIEYESNVYDMDWHHYVWVVPDLPNPRLIDAKIFEDGELLQITIPLGYDEYTSINTVPLYTMTIGDFISDHNNQHFYFAGSLDDIRIYNRALNAAEIDSLYHENGWTGNQ
jgi:hypothetical protein